jgi:hypothetical protein
MKTFSHLWQYIVEFFLEWEIFQIKVVEKIKIHILCSTTFSENRAFYEIMSKNMVEPWTPQMAKWRLRSPCTHTHTHTHPHTPPHTHTHTHPSTHTHTIYIYIYNIYYFSTTTMVSWTGLSITLYVYCLSFLFSLRRLRTKIFITFWSPYAPRVQSTFLHFLHF